MCLHVFQGFLSLPNFFPNVSSCVQAFSITVSLHVYFTHAHTHTHTLSHSTPTTQVYFWIQEFLPSWLFLPCCWFFILTPQCLYFFFFFLSFIGSHYLFLIVLICNRVFCLFWFGYSLIWCRYETIHDPPQQELSISKRRDGVSFRSVVVITLA